MKKKINLSEEDKKIWKEFTKNPKGIFDKDIQQNIKERFVSYGNNSLI